MPLRFFSSPAINEVSSEARKASSLLDVDGRGSFATLKPLLESVVRRDGV